MIVAALALMISLAAATPPAVLAEAECLEIRDADARLGFAGRLGEGRFPSPAVFAPPEGEHAFILRLDRPICVDDGGQFADPAERFDRIHLWGSPPVMAALRQAQGQYVQLFGRAYGAHTGHHHAPLVMEVDDVIVIEGWSAE